jgi:hypothetical protein
MSPVARYFAVLPVFVLLPAAFARQSLTVLLQFEDKHSEQSIDAMKKELESLVTDVDVNWRLLSEVRSDDVFHDLVVVKFKGACEMASTSPFLIDERGYYAFTYTSGGQVLPFSEVECDKVRTSIRPAMSPGDLHNRGEYLLGRALGRVLAHELHHVLARSMSHSKTGVNRRALTPGDLIADRITH